jgi:pimeloyl-ACP methyl ester carboxylesterase
LDDALRAFAAGPEVADKTAAPRIVAAGHAAAYVLHHAAHHPGTIARAALIAPTWRGPLPTMAGGDRPLFGRIRRAIEAPLVGPALYRLNVSDFVLRKMVCGHVYSDPHWLTAARLNAKRAVVDAPGARFASAAFVTGGLDRAATREQFLALARRADLPLLVVYGAETPPRSRAEMEALAELPQVSTLRVKRGKLSVHEEFPDDVCATIGAFLGEPSMAA